MKHLYVWIVVGMVGAVTAVAQDVTTNVSADTVLTFAGNAITLTGWAQDGTFPMGAPVGAAPANTPGPSTVEAILTTIIFILGVLVKVYSGWNKKNDEIAKTVIRGVELAVRSGGDVKQAIKNLAADEGNTAILHKKVQKTIANEPTPTADAPSMPPPASATDTRHTTNS